MSVTQDELDQMRMDDDGAPPVRQETSRTDRWLRGRFASEPAHGGNDSAPK